MEDVLSMSEDIFVDCSTLLSKNLKLENQVHLLEKEKGETRKETEFNDILHQECLDEFKTVSRERKDKTLVNMFIYIKIIS